jgi:VWFA-related protein
MKIDYGVRLLAPFTTRPGGLRHAIEAATVGDTDVRGSRPPASPPVAAVQAQDPSAPVDPALPRIPDLRGVADAVGKEVLSLSRRVEGYDSLYAVLGLARALAVVEGRKSVVYFAEAWHLPVGVRPVYDDAVSAANRANVAIHTVDARGLTSHKPMALTTIDTVLDRFRADYQRGDGDGPATRSVEAGGVPGTEPGLRAKMEPREEQLSGPRLERLAEDTGGLGITSTNDLGAGLAGVAEELRQYYEVAYTPANPVQDGRFRRIAAWVSRPGVRLRTRAGYFATPGRTATLAAYELPLMAALAASTPARDFTSTSAVLHFAPKGPERECVVLAGVPLSEVQVVQRRGGRRLSRAPRPLRPSEG